MPPGFARPGSVAEPVQGIADLYVRLALPPQFDCLCDHLGVVAITKGRLNFGPWEQMFYGEFEGSRPKRVLVKVIGE